MTTGEVLAARQVAAEGVERLFTLVGGHTTGLLNACATAGIEIVSVRDEDAAVHMAVATAMLTGRPGVACVAAGPGATNVVTGTASASVAGAAVVLLAGSPPTQQAGRGAFQEIDQLRIFAGVTKQARVLLHPERAAEQVRDAFRVAGTPRCGPVYLELPTNVLRGPSGGEPIAPPDRVPRSAPAPADVEAAGALVGRSRRPVVLAGPRVLGPGAPAAVAALVEDWRVPFLATTAARGVLAAEHAMNLSAARSFLLSSADLVVVAGAGFDFSLGYGAPPRFGPGTRIVHLDDAVEELHRNRIADVVMLADLPLAVEALRTAGARPDVDRSWMAEAASRHAAAVADVRMQAASSDRPVHPLRLCVDVFDACPEGTTFVVDGGDVLSFARLVVHPGVPGHYLDSGTFGCLGVGLPYANAGALARPGRPSVCITGDGALGFQIMELETAVRHGLAVVVVVSNNSAWGIERNSQLVDQHDDRVIATELSHARYDLMATALGARGRRVEDPGELAGAVHDAIESGVPSLVDVITDVAVTSPDVRRGLARVPDQQALDRFGS